MALINHTECRIITVALKGKDNLVIMPGVNEIDENTLNGLKNHPSFKQRMKDGKIIILNEERPGSEGVRPIDEMLDYIPKMFDTRLLKKIIKTDGRDQVVSAAKSQLDTIMIPKKEEKKDESEHFR